jgi:hypothetical protein
MDPNDVSSLNRSRWTNAGVLDDHEGVQEVTPLGPMNAAVLSRRNNEAGGPYHVPVAAPLPLAGASATVTISVPHVQRYGFPASGQVHSTSTRTRHPHCSWVHVSNAPGG